jgi:hypothetical protein
MLCRDSKFWDYLYEQSLLLETNESACIEWLKNYLNVHSRADIKTNSEAQGALKLLYGQYKEWKNE